MTLDDIFLANRPALMRFLKARNAGDDAEDLLHEVWLRLQRTGGGAGSGDRPQAIRAPLAYLYRMADSIMIDRHRQRRQAQLRERAWSEVHDLTSATTVMHGSAAAMLEAKQVAAQIMAMLAAEGERVLLVFRRHRIDGSTQRQIATELGVSLGTVEGDLRRANIVLERFAADEDRYEPANEYGR